MSDKQEYGVKYQVRGLEKAYQPSTATYFLFILSPSTTWLHCKFFVLFYLLNKTGFNFLALIVQLFPSTKHGVT